MKKISTEHILLSGLFIFLIAIAGTVDYHRVVNYLFGDEAVYYMMAQSFGNDLDLEYSPKDLIRVYNDGWHAGPQGVFLTKLDDGKIYYAKSFAYSLLLAPFQLLFGMNGFLILNMLMLFLMILMGWLYLRQFNPPLLSLLVSISFFILSAAFVYAFWLTPEIFNMFCINLGLFLWLYQREQVHISGERTRRGFAPGHWLRWLVLTPQGRFYLAPIPIAVAGASKLPNILFVFPILADGLFEVFLHIRQSPPQPSFRKAVSRQWPTFKKVLGAGLIFAGVVLLFYGVQYLFIGHFNQYAGDRKSFYWEFPLESGKDVWEKGVRSSNDDYFEQAFYYRSKILLHNVYYYVFGRFTGMLPYFCCSFLALYYFLRARGSRPSSPARSQKSTILPGELPRRLFLLLTLVAGISAYIVLAPSNYQGGGGAFGNRFFVNIYPGFFFLMTSLSGIGPLLISWLVGSFFLAQVLINPFQYSSYPAMQAFRFPYRLLPVELTLLNTLPTTLSQSLVQGEMPHKNPTHKLYFFDENAADRSPHEFWVRGRSRADLAIRVLKPASSLTMTLINGPIANSVDVTVGGTTQAVHFERAREERRLVFPLRNPIPFFHSSVYPVSIRSHEGFVPKFVAGTGLADSRFLGARVELSVEAFDAGKALFERGSFEDALVEFEKALEENPQHIYALYYRGRSYQALDKHEEALRNFEASKELLSGFQAFFRYSCQESNEQCPLVETSPQNTGTARSSKLTELLAPLRVQYEAEDLARNSGHVIADSQASGGESVQFSAQEESPGFLAYGQYLTLPAGDYQVRYRAKIAPAQGRQTAHPEVAFWFDVYSRKKQGVLKKASAGLPPAHGACDSEGFRDYLLNFSLARPGQLQFRVESTGTADIALDTIEVYPRLPLQLFQAFAEVKQALGSQDDAKRLFEQILEFDRFSPEIRSGYLKTLFALQRWDDALEFIDDAVDCSEFRSGLVGTLLIENEFSELPQALYNMREKLFSSFHPKVMLQKNFGQLIEFLGYSRSSEQSTAGQDFDIELFWKALTKIPADYSIVIDIVKKGDLLASPTLFRLKRRLGLPSVTMFRHEHQPLHGSYPSSQWLPGELLREKYVFQLPSNLKAGSYEIRLNLLNVLTKEPLRIMGKETHVIGDIEVKNGPGMD